MDLIETAFVLFFNGHLAECEGVLEALNQRIVSVHGVLRLLDGLEDLGGIGCIVPKIGGKRHLLQLLDLGGQCLHTKCLTEVGNIRTHGNELSLGFF